jgi:hypothetical protein
MKYLLVFLVALVVLDGVVTQFLIVGGGVREGNPFLQPLVGKTAFLVIKILGALLCALILWDIHRRFPRMAVITVWCGIIGYGAILLWNCSLFLLV